MGQHNKQPARGKWLLAGVAAALVLIWIGIRLSRSGRIEPGLLQPRADQRPNRPLGEVLVETVPSRYELIGSIQSRVPIMAASRVAARVIDIKVHAGDHVSQGQVIVRLDASDLKAQIAQAQGEFAAAQAEFVRAQADQKRFSALFARGSVTASERDNAQAAYRGAAGRVAQAHAALAAARASSEYATVRSPVGGVVVERLVEPGDMAMPGKPLVRLYDENAMRVELMVPEELARSVEIGTALDVRVGASGGIYRTRVSEIVPAADPASRSFMIRAPLPSGRYLQPGMFARAALTVGSQPTLTVPRDAIRAVGQLQTVRVLSGHLIQTRMISLGRSFGDRVEVLAGVAAGDRVIIDGQQTGGK
jgi:RND family efflux transporter MFP subunit